MSTLSINVPDEIREAAEQVVAAGRFATVSEYIATLIRQDQVWIERQSLESHLVGRVDAGPSREMTDADFDDIRARLDDEVRRRRTP
jgi:Arc/MetJ-type ribon-helix-helix transcriptional regulator